MNYKSKLDKIFSEFIRLRDSNENGYCSCISCGKIEYWKHQDCGHFINRKHMSTRFDEKNCNSQCRNCNRFDEGNSLGYMRGLIKKYGDNILQELEIRKSRITKLDKFEYEIMIKHYKKKIKQFKLNNYVK